MKKNLLILFLLSMIPFSSTAQNAVYITLHGGGAYNQFKPGKLNDFVNSYNNYYSQYLSDPMDPFSTTMTGFRKGMGLFFNGNKSCIGFEYSKVRYKQSSSAAFSSNMNRTVDIEFVNWDFNFETGFRIGKNGSFGLLYGTTYRTGKITSYVWWNDKKNKSLEHYYALNGVYKGIPQTDLNLGINLRIPLLPFVALQMQAYYAFPLFEKSALPNESAFSDDGPGKNLYTTYFPYDVEQYFNNISNAVYDYDQNVIANRFRGLYVNASIITTIKVTK
ncbi:MAG: hypothetical protein Fur0041_06030 [Bacteroidia bacterium]